MREGVMEHLKSSTSEQQQRAIDTLEYMISGVLEYFHNSLKVWPVEGNLKLERFCEMWYLNSKGEIQCVDYKEPAECYSLEVPENHLEEC